MLKYQRVNHQNMWINRDKPYWTIWDKTWLCHHRTGGFFTINRWDVAPSNYGIKTLPYFEFKDQIQIVSSLDTSWRTWNVRLFGYYFDKKTSPELVHPASFLVRQLGRVCEAPNYVLFRVQIGYNVGPPSDVWWSINPINNSYRYHNHSEIGVMFTNWTLSRGAPHCMTFVVNSLSVSPYPNLLLIATCFRCWFLQSSPGNQEQVGNCTWRHLAKLATQNSPRYLQFIKISYKVLPHNSNILQ